MTAVPTGHLLASAVLLGSTEPGGRLLERGGRERVEVRTRLLDRLDGLEAGLLELDAAAFEDRDAVGEDVVAEPKLLQVLGGRRLRAQRQWPAGGIPFNREVSGAYDDIHRETHAEEPQVLAA